MLLIEVENLYKRFPPQRTLKKPSTLWQMTDPRWVLEDVSFKIPAGRFVGLLGENGAGKTTLLRILATLLTPTSGRVRLNGWDTGQHEKKVREQMGYVCSDFGLAYQLNGYDNLLYFAALQNLPPALARDRSLAVLKLVGLFEEREKLVYRYSSGMQQRLNLAKGLLHDPQVLLMDEPTRGLDPKICSSLMGYLKRDLVEKAGKTVVLSTHKLEEAKLYCDEFLALEKGRLKAYEKNLL